MSRSGYTDDYGDEDPLALGRWRGAVRSATKGKRGQAMLRDLLAALDAMSDKSLVAESLVTAEGEFCTLGVLGQKRGLPIADVDPEDYEAVAAMFGVAAPLVQEIVYLNDEGVSEYDYIEQQGPQENPYWPHPRIRVKSPDVYRKRWQYMRDWVASQITNHAAKPQS